MSRCFQQDKNPFKNYLSFERCRNYGTVGINMTHEDVVVVRSDLCVCVCVCVSCRNQNSVVCHCYGI